MTKPTRILILRGGFAGTTVALLSDTLSAPGSGKKVKVSLPTCFGALSDQAHHPLALALQDAKLQGLLSVGIGSFGGDPKQPWPVSDHWKSS